MVQSINKNCNEFQRINGWQIRFNTWLRVFFISCFQCYVYGHFNALYTLLAFCYFYNILIISLYSNESVLNLVKTNSLFTFSNLPF